MVARPPTLMKIQERGKRRRSATRTSVVATRIARAPDKPLSSAFP